MVLAEKIAKFFHELVDEKAEPPKPKAIETEAGIKEAYAGFVTLSACDPFVGSSQNITPVFMGTGIN